VVFASFSIYLGCLFFDAYMAAGHQSSEQGYELLAVGWLGIFFGYYSWLANPSLLASWICLLKRRTLAAQILSGLALLLALSFLLHPDIIVDEGGTRKEVIAYDVGYYLWLFSMMIMVGGASIFRALHKRQDILC